MDSEDTAIDYESESDTGTPERRSGFKWLLRIFVGGVLALALLVLALPMIVAMFGLQNILLGRATVEQDVSASAGSASLGWFTPITLSHMKVERDDGTLTVDAASFSTERSLLDLLLDLLLGLPDVGTITLDRPSVVLRPGGETSESDDGHGGSVSKDAPPQLRVVIRDGAVAIQLPSETEPVFAVDEISFVARTERSEDVSLLVVEPVKLIDRRRLTPELCSRGLQFIAPILSEATTVSGELSVEVKEFQLPIGGVTDEDRAKLTKCSGMIVLHEVETGLRNPVLSQIVSVIAKLSIRRFDSVCVADETRVNFLVENGRVYHEGLTLLIPELSDELLLMTSGWVDLEENIDIRVLVNLSGFANSRIEMLTSFMQAPLELRMTGTLKDPKIELPEERSMLDELAGQLTGGDAGTATGGKSNLTGAISDLISGLAGDSEDKPDTKKAARGIFDLIQAIQGDSDDDQPKKQP
jgi:hypothetical protein